MMNLMVHMSDREPLGYIVWECDDIAALGSNGMDIMFICYLYSVDGHVILGAEMT